MDAAGWGALGAVIYGIIREVVGGIIQINSSDREREKKDREVHEKRLLGYVEEAKAEYENARTEKLQAVEEARKEKDARIDCEKAQIRLEAKIELLTRLGNLDLSSSKVHEALESIENQLKSRKEEERETDV